MSDNPTEHMEPINIPAKVDVLIEFRDGKITVDVVDDEGHDLPVNRLELTTLLGLTIMSIGYNAAAQDLEEE